MMHSHTQTISHNCRRVDGALRLSRVRAGVDHNISVRQHCPHSLCNLLAESLCALQRHSPRHSYVYICEGLVTNVVDPCGGLANSARRLFHLGHYLTDQVRRETVCERVYGSYSKLSCQCEDNNRYDCGCK